MSVAEPSLQGTKTISYLPLSAPEDGLRGLVLAAVASVLFGKDQDLLSTGIELQVVTPGLEPELESP